ncbi:hypothetical protein GWI33_006127 [Rhynchophorus ferrugineus]|uniref:Peptidase S1 domain-containing protein n=1 Tax=Rhynchophorus ferrugineus TaxID=354439 RepID=A0A834MFN9_RHYFE|nr:hypothetical protein GWI33_006127 [Rhynchophorus ferrugineus]
MQLSSVYCFKVLMLCLVFNTFTDGARRSKKLSKRPNRIKIVGGDRADIKSYPYQLSLLYNGRHICGASIISPNFALTAAHCTIKLDASKTELRAGSTYKDSGGQKVRVKRIHQHPKYNSNTIDYDVSVLEVSPQFTYNNSIKCISISSVEPADGAAATATGWGTLKENANYLPTELQTVQVPIISRSKCLKIYKFRGLITTRMLCAGLVKGGKDSCQGDSGGPLTVDGKQVGIVSWGFGCGRPRSPGVYTDLINSEIRNFIRSVANV